MKAVLDAPVLVSAFIKPDSLPGAVVRAGIAGRYDLCLSLDILAETGRILRDKPRLRHRYRYLDQDVVRYVEDLLAVADVVIELPLLSSVSRDPDDDHVIAAALAAGAAVIVTGDDDLLSLEAYEGIRMLTVRAFHDQWTP